MSENEIQVIKRYIDAKVRQAVREQAWLHLSWKWPGEMENKELAVAEREIQKLIDRATA